MSLYIAIAISISICAYIIGSRTAAAAAAA
jgi:hypothetical protein